MEKSITTAEELARIGREHELAELEYEDSDVKIRLTFEAPAVTAAPAFDPALLAAASMSAGASAAASSAPAAQTTAAAAAPSANGGGAHSGETINSPLAGVFYRSPRPDADAFVSDGQQVGAGQTLCIVEAMKLMNEITADRPCKIVKILVENAEAVEEGQPLFIIE